jgi:hypothetical protein
MLRQAYNVPRANRADARGQVLQSKATDLHVRKLVAYLIALLKRRAAPHGRSTELHLALAVEKKYQFVTADKYFLRKLYQVRQHTLRGRANSLIEAVQL